MKEYLTKFLSENVNQGFKTFIYEEIKKNNSPADLTLPIDKLIKPFDLAILIYQYMEICREKDFKENLIPLLKERSYCYNSLDNRHHFNNNSPAPFCDFCLVIYDNFYGGYMVRLGLADIVDSKYPVQTHLKKIIDHPDGKYFFYTKIKGIIFQFEGLEGINFSWGVSCEHTKFKTICGKNCSKIIENLEQSPNQVINFL